jgi:hypothetical protein
MVGLVRKIDIKFISNPDYIRFNKNRITNRIANFLKKYVCAGTKNALGVEKIKKTIKLEYKLN